MTHDVVVQHLARMDILEVYNRAASDAPETAAKWLARLQQTIQSLQHPIPLSHQSVRSLRKAVTKAMDTKQPLRQYAVSGENPHPRRVPAEQLEA